ncbi:ribosomal protein S18 acetylase RimI-like enzyme [Geodermatophilus bullaregiensis]|uniref:GNAT family N-acetyltransferase n=1 Tax=Geodermatophilus bullaregiensis TaxID=1564160 RepID=UPI00195C405C|nr:GNAT family N-acetyltransferase [Geodermatophilus bullaregiensis]MBM7806211.1 ribosomal protein S18 acetylase RimI-like enzyme [Geodermatophilus bullaregiensis]
MLIRHHDPADDEVLAPRLLQLQHAAYAVEARLIGDDRIPALHEDLPALLGAGLRWLVAQDDDAVVGALGWRPGTAAVDVDRLVVDPAHARRGTGRALVAAVLAEAAGQPVTVSTGRHNTPARRLYASTGFREVGEREVLPGLWVVDAVHDGRASGPSATAGRRGRPRRPGRVGQTPTERSASTCS